MANKDENTVPKIIPHNLYTNQLNSGHFELSAYIAFALEDDVSAKKIVWEIQSEEGTYSLNAAHTITDQGENPEIVIQITATLPPWLESGLLKINIETDHNPIIIEQPINQYIQEHNFILPLSEQALTVVGHRIGETHRSALQIPSQQFGWDFLGLGSEGLSIVNINESAPLLTSDFPGFGMNVIAPSDGLVCEVRDRESDIQEIGQLPEDLSYYQEDLTRALGNFVIIEHGNDAWSVLAHLKKDSVRVSAGQKVSSKDILGSLGNSGFSSGPHLHFHVMDSPNIFNASPLPVKLTLEDGVFAPQAGDIISNA